MRNAENEEKKTITKANDKGENGKSIETLVYIFFLNHIKSESIRLILKPNGNHAIDVEW